MFLGRNYIDTERSTTATHAKRIKNLPREMQVTRYASKKSEKEEGKVKNGKLK